MIAFYENHKGERINLLEHPYRLETGDFFDYEWECLSYGRNIYGFQRRMMEKTVRLEAFCARAELAAAMNRLESVTQADVMNSMPGKLYVNDQYLVCYVKQSKKTEWETDVLTVIELTIVSDKPFWVSELFRSFLPKGEGEVADGGLNHPFNYPFNYTVSDRGIVDWNIDHFNASPYFMIIYGPVTNPRILINNQPIDIYTTLESNEHLTIDSHAHKIIKHLSNGTKANLFDDRYKTTSIFDPIPAGNVTFNWPGTFGFDLTVYLERNEPPWT